MNFYLEIYSAGRIGVAMRSVVFDEESASGIEVLDCIANPHDVRQFMIRLDDGGVLMMPDKCFREAMFILRETTATPFVFAQPGDTA